MSEEDHPLGAEVSRTFLVLDREAVRVGSMGEVMHLELSIPLVGEDML